MQSCFWAWCFYLHPVQRLFLDNSPHSVFAYHIDATGQLLPGAYGGDTVENTATCQVVDAISEGGISNILRPINELVDACVVAKTT